ncbi:NAD(+) hydrolase sarm1-like isoform X2 [Rhopalosiphum padi]|nr:NAD(+) hydrolase sarm1-like isoform X2 [Rhopalosiphum padi]
MFKRKFNDLNLTQEVMLPENVMNIFLSAESLNSENPDYVIKNSLNNIKYVIHIFRRQEKRTTRESKFITGLLEQLFVHSENMCMDVIECGGLEIILEECRSRDTTTLQNCARALANLSLFGGAKIHKLMIHHHAHIWLFTLAFNADDSVKYYALLTAAVLATDKDIKAAMDNCDTLNLIDPFIATHFTADFDRIARMIGRCQGEDCRWLQRLVPVLSCDRREAHTMAAFHFSVKVGLQSQCLRSRIAETFRTIGAIVPLKNLAGSLNNVTSELAAKALWCIGEQVPRSLSQEVPRWTVNDVLQWAKSVGFGECVESLAENQINGDLLLKLTEKCLKIHVGLYNGIMRKRFTRELHKLKQLADYSCKDPTNLNSFLQSIGPEFSVYTYSMLNAGIDYDSISSLTDDRLAYECGIKNSIHRSIILNSIKGER